MHKMILGFHSVLSTNLNGGCTGDAAELDARKRDGEGVKEWVVIVDERPVVLVAAAEDEDAPNVKVIVDGMWNLRSN